jgi:DNA modification methylase
MSEEKSMAKNTGKGNEVEKTGLYWPGKRSEVDRVILPFQTVETINESKADREDLALFRQKGEPAPGWRNKLIWGDNKYIMASLLQEFAGRINLIYIDPPFATGADFSINIKLGDLEWTKEASVIEEKAYRDTWGRGLDSYLQMMYDRLVLMRELLADNGSIYVHLDWHVGHYVKVIMDEIFGKDNFVNEIVANRGRRKSLQYQFEHISSLGCEHDIIFLYSRNQEAQYQHVKSEIRAKGDQWQSFWRGNVERPTMLYELLGFNPTHGQFLWTKERAERAVKNYQDFLKSGEPDLVTYWKKTGGKLEFIATLPGRAYPQYWIPPKVEGIIGDVWTDIQSYSYSLGYDTEKHEDLLSRVIMMASREGDLVADFFCGSGTTGAVAEKLGRRWIMADLSKFAIHTSRKRLLDIPNCKPFEVLNLGKYQKAKLKENGISRYVEFILKLYRAERITGYVTLHGKKAGRMVHIGAVDSIVTEREIRETVKECASAGIKTVDILGWDFEMGLHDLVDRIGDEYSVKIRLVQIPREALEVRDVAREEVKFFDLNYLEIEHKLSGKTLTIVLKDFVISNPEYLPPEVREKVKKFTDYIDYWAVDFDYKNDTFHNMWQSFRTRKHPSLETKCSHIYENAGKYLVLVKVVDIFGNDTNKLIEVKI